MPARIVSQDEGAREEFRKRIQAKVQAEKDDMKQKIDETVPSFLSWAFRPLAGLAFDMKRNSYNSKGEGGELNVGLHLRFALSNEWVLMNDVTLEPEPEVFSQTDHVVIGPPGMFVIETKAWDGAFTGYKDRWKRKEGNKWVSCHSPTRQNLRHVKLIRQWFSQTGIFNVTFPTEQWIHPIVVFTRASWLKTTDCSMPVIDSALSLALHLRNQKERYLDAEQIEKISMLLAYPQLRNFKPGPVIMVTPPEEVTSTINKDDTRDEQEDGIARHVNNKQSDIKVETGRSRGGKDFVRVYGSKEDAEEIRKGYISGGKEPGPVNRDKYCKEVWYFYY